MKTRLSKMIAAGAVLMLAVVPIASANMHKGGGHEGWSKDDLKSKFFHKVHFILDHADELGLTEAKQEEIKNLKYKVKKELIRNGAEVDVLKIDIKRALYGHAIDVSAVNELLDQKYDLKKNKAKMLVQSLADLKQMLSAEQYQQMKELYKAEKKS